MALPQNIPTSFVPKQPVQSANRPTRVTSGGLFALISYFVGGVMVVAAIGVFAYGYYLNSVRDAKAAALVDAQKGVSQETVKDFLRLRDRLSSAKSLLDNHITLSSFFDDLEKLTLQTVRFNALRISILDDHTGSLEMSGTARTFNALAAQAEAMNAEPRIKRSVFSGIAVQKDGTVNFTLTASLDPSLITGDYDSTPPDTSAQSTGVVPVFTPVNPTSDTGASVSTSTTPATGGKTTGTGTKTGTP